MKFQQATTSFLLLFTSAAVAAVGSSWNIAGNYVYASTAIQSSPEKQSERHLLTNNGNNALETPSVEEIPGLFQGDIIATKELITALYGADTANTVEKAGMLRKGEELKKKKNEKKRDLGIMVQYDLLWKTRDANGVVLVPYEILSTMPSDRQQVALDAMKYIEDNTGVIKFVLHSTESDYIKFQDTDSGCYSYIGRIGGEQALNMETGCTKFNIVHELYHSLGFFHEQSRSDRDLSVIINLANVQAGMESNFNKEATNSLGSPYDYGSIMHYGATFFSNTKFTCTLTDAKPNTAALIHFKKNDLDQGTDYCLSIFTGGMQYADNNFVNLRPCGDNNYQDQYWIIEAFGSYNIIRVAGNPTYCLTPNYGQNSPDGSMMVIKKCVTNIYTNQLFVFDQTTWDDVAFRWQKHDGFTLARNTDNSVPNTYMMLLSSFGLNNGYDQRFGIEFVTKTTPGSPKVNSFCQENGRMTTIDAKGNSVGQRDKLSEQDILQLQLLYQCSSGPRNIDTFCTVDCKCKFGQGKCTTSDQCQSGLECRSDGTSINKCLTKIPTPTATPVTPTIPTRQPTQSLTDAPTAPTAPTLPTKLPTPFKTGAPSSPTVPKPTKKPTSAPTKKPVPPTAPTVPTKSPTIKPTKVPTVGDTLAPSVATDGPTFKPTKQPSRRPTKSPVLPCSYPKETKCSADLRCMWFTDGEKAKCQMLNCSILPKSQCRNEKKKCMWLIFEKICLKK